MADLTKERKELLDRLVSEGKTKSEISRNYGFGYKTINTHYPDYYPPRKSLVAPDRKRLLDQLVAENATLEEMRLGHGFSVRTVRKYYPGYRSSEEVYGFTEDEVKTIKAMMEERAPASAIAEALGVHPGKVRKYFPEAVWTAKEAAEFGSMVRSMKKEVKF